MASVSHAIILSSTAINVSKAAGPDTSQSDGESVAIENASAANAVAESIPAAYRSADTSGLTAEVKACDNVLDCALTKSFKGAGK